MSNTVTVGNWDPELREYTNLQQIPWIRVGDELPTPGTLVYVSEYGIHTVSQDGRQLVPVPIEDAEVAPEEPQQVTNKEDTDMDSISRYCLLAYLRANPDMSHEEIVQFIEGMQPMEVDGADPTAIILTVGGNNQLEQYTSAIQAAASQPAPITTYKNEGRDIGITDVMIPGVIYQYWPASMG